jgi:hypothetical protein
VGSIVTDLSRRSAPEGAQVVVDLAEVVDIVNVVTAGELVPLDASLVSLSFVVVIVEDIVVPP